MCLKKDNMIPLCEQYKAGITVKEICTQYNIKECTFRW